MDWSTCIVCQKKTSEPLRCPLNVHGADKSAPAVYGSFLEKVTQFRELNALPVPLAFGAATDVDELIRNHAQWHKSCHDQFNAQKLARAKKRGRDSTPAPEDRCRRPRKCFNKTSCIFCTKEDGILHEFKTLGADHNVRSMARDLLDSDLLTRIEGVGDLIALEAKYHLACLVGLRNRHRSLIRNRENIQDASKADKKARARAFAELVTHIENEVEEGTLLFKFASLRHLYESRLADFGIKSEVNKVRFKEQILKHFPYSQEQSDGKNVILVFEKGMQQMLKQAMETDYEADALILAKAARIVREDIFRSCGFNFTGSFPPDCQKNSVPANLKSMVTMLMKGADLKDQDSTDSQACLTASQIILFNCKKRARRDKQIPSSRSRHSLEFEPPLPLYIGLNLHTQTRSRKLVTQMHDLGLSVSYDRVLHLENHLATAVCEDMKRKGVVCPVQLRFQLFTVGALDNIDHNPSSTTATGSFHGTGISLFQFPTSSNMGQSQSGISLALLENTTQDHRLPENFTTVPAVALRKESVAVPRTSYDIRPISGHLDKARDKENKWLKHAISLMGKEELVKGDAVAWSAYHASCEESPVDLQPAITQLLPLFSEKAATAAMVKHGMNVLREAIQFLNPGQLPVIALDAPLYALAKFVQWHWPHTHGEDQYVVMFGGLHVEMAVWKTLGDYLEASGWTNALNQAGIASSGTANSFLTASHLTKTRHAHQVSALALAKMQQDAHQEAVGDTPSNDEDFEAWRRDMAARSPTFHYWDTILRLEILGLIFVRAHREQDFPLYVETLKALVPWFFALDHHNYARWLPVHIRDMESLPPAIQHQFEVNGNWVVPKTAKRFSTIPIDQAHEQNNALVKGEGGAVGLTENPIAFRKWMVAGPEQARLLAEFGEQYANIPNDDQYHHEEGLATQKTIQKQTVDLIQVISEMGNPFKDDIPELLALDTRNVIDHPVVNTVRTIEAVGKEQYETYKKSVLTDATHSIHDPIKKNKLPLFRSPTPKTKSKQVGQVSMLKDDVALFSRLYIVTQHRDGDLDTFFKHENHPYPPSLAERGKLRQGKKSDLTNILAQKTQEEPSGSFDVRVLDGAAVVHLLPVTGITTFDDYASGVFIPYIMRQLETSMRVDVVWDRYLDNSIKESTREKRGKGVRRKVAGQTKIPGNWPDFLRDPTNKVELFQFLTEKIVSTTFPDGKQVFATSGASVVCSGTDHSMPPCDHEEADTRIVFHLQDALECGCTKCLVRTVDTDVLVILIGKYHFLAGKYPSADIWVAFGSGKNFVFLHVNAICSTLGKEKSTALPVFHCFTGCDTTSSFFGKGKKSAWEAWGAYPEVTDAFNFIVEHPHAQITVDCQEFQMLERFTVVIYDKTSTLVSVNEARKELFCQKNTTMENIPPTQQALLQHTKRAVYQAGIWTTCHQAQQQTPTAEGCGWTLDAETKSWVPVWSSLPVAAKAVSELVKCACKSAAGCGGRCSCKKARWKCTELCSCKCEK